MVTAVQLDVCLITGSYAGLDQPNRGGIGHMIMNRPEDQQRLINAVRDFGARRPRGRSVNTSHGAEVGRSRTPPDQALRCR